MAVLTAAQIQAKIDAYFVAGGGITALELNEVCTDLNDSKEPLIQEFTTVQRDALAGVDLYEARKIYNTTNDRMEFYNGATWIACSQKPTVAEDCSGNPNYREGSVGDQYIVSVAGKIGGASGKTVYVGDLVYCIAKNAGGNEATVGTSWAVCYSGSSTDTPTRYVQVTLSSAEILALFTAPKQLVAAPGAGKVIVPERIVYNFIWNSIAYATNTTMLIRNPTGTDGAGFAISGVANKLEAEQISGQTIIANEKLEVFVQTGDPTAGDSTMTVSVYYKIHTV